MAETETTEPRDLRLRRQFFPGAEKLIFHTSRRGFVPLPILLRKLLRHLSAPELRILVYLYLRASRYGICYPTLEEIAYEVGLSGRKNLIPHIKTLVEKKLISTHQAVGRNFYLVHDPRVALEHLVREDKVSSAELIEINGLCEDLRQEPIEAKSKRIKSATHERGNVLA